MTETLTPPYALGIDVGGTNTKYGLVNHRGEIFCHGSIPTHRHETVEAFIDDLHLAITSAIRDFGGIDCIRGIGIGAPNGNIYKGTIEYAPNLKWKGIVPLASMIGERFGVPARLTNDANAAAVGEMTYGAAKGMRDFIMITLGTGVGSGIVANGQLIYGHDGFAGELGHNIIIPDGRLHPGTGEHGSLEAYASATGVARTAAEFLDRDPSAASLMREYPREDIDARIVYECASRGDSLAIEVYNFTGRILGLALANFVMFSSPEAIIFFGGMSKAGDLILNPTRENMEKHLLPIFQNKVKLIFSELKEADAAILGASALVWEMKESA